MEVKNESMRYLEIFVCQLFVLIGSDFGLRWFFKVLYL
jgi:hypothetical protein